MFSKQKSCLQRNTIYLESCRKVLMSRHPALHIDDTVFLLLLCPIRVRSYLRAVCLAAPYNLSKPDGGRI